MSEEAVIKYINAPLTEETCNGLRQIKKSFPNLIPHKIQYINDYICRCLALFFILGCIRLP